MSVVDTSRKPLGAAFTEQTKAILAHRAGTGRRRGWVIRRVLVAADAIGLTLAFVLSEVLYERTTNSLLAPLGASGEYVIFLATLPVWLLAAKLFGLYDRDEERTDHSTADDLMHVFLLVTVGVFAFTRISLVTDLVTPYIPKMTVFWALAIAFMATGRVIARTLARRGISYMQNAVVVGAGDVGQLVARKLRQHPEYRINLVGFVDNDPPTLEPHLSDVAVLGGCDDLGAIVKTFDVERVIFADADDDADLVHAARKLRNSGVQVDVVPRLFEIIGPAASFHHVESLPLVGLPPGRIPRTSRLLKRGCDVFVSGLLLLVAAPLFAVIAILIKRDSRGPVFFRQTRLGMDMKEFTLLKFRTMKADTDDREHQDFIATLMNSAAAPQENGLYKLGRTDRITGVGRWLRRTSLDELPQLINVLRGDMSLVGPRPCLRYETVHFAPHHFDRFLVPAGMTGLWQVAARSRATFVEALEMDVAYAHSWSLGLDVSLLLKTPLQLLRPHATR